MTIQLEKTSGILHCHLMGVNLQLSARPYFSSKPPRTFWLCPSEPGSEMSACPLDPDEKRHTKCESEKRQKYLIPGIFQAWSYLQRKPHLLKILLQKHFLLLVGLPQIWTNNFGTCWSRFEAGSHMTISLVPPALVPLMVRACSSCSVAMVMLCMSLSSCVAARWLTVSSST